MPKIETTSADTPPGGLGKTLIANAGTLTSINFLEKDGKSYLDDPDIIAFSETCKAARHISSYLRKKHALKRLLTAVVCGNEDFARKIVIIYPELLLDSSVSLDSSEIVGDLPGKEIKDVTPLQAAIRAGDVDMMQMIKEVLHQKQQNGVTLSFEPELEMQRQFTAIYPKGDIDAVETAQRVKAQEFKATILNDIISAINAATEAQVKCELLNTHENHYGYSELNAALHNFREKFSSTVNQEQIFNPFYLLVALEIFGENLVLFNIDRLAYQDLFWDQVIGYIQRHLPACYLQAFAQGIYHIAEEDKKLQRDIKFYPPDEFFFLRPNIKDLKNLGYQFGLPPGGLRSMGLRVGIFPVVGDVGVNSFQKLLRTKKSGLENLCTRRVETNNSSLTCRQGA
jgi:hypothetical protein